MIEGEPAPAAPPALVPAFQARADDGATSGAGQRIRLLVAEDCSVSRKMLCRLLGQDEAIEIIGQAADGAAVVECAYDLVRQGRPADIVLLDVEMPVMDGLAVLPLLAMLEPPPRVIMVSALTRRGASITVQAMLRGAADFIGKPTGGNPTLAEFTNDLLAKIKGLVTPPPPAEDDVIVASAPAAELRERSQAPAGVATRDVERLAPGLVRNAPAPRDMQRAASPSAAGPGLVMPNLRAVGADFPVEAARQALRGLGATFAQIVSPRAHDVASQRPQAAGPVAVTAPHEPPAQGVAGRSFSAGRFATAATRPHVVPAATSTARGDAVRLRIQERALAAPSGRLEPASRPAGQDERVVEARSAGRAVVDRGRVRARPIDVIAIGCSTGGPQALLNLLKSLVRPVRVPIVITQHMQRGFTTILAEQLRRQADLPVKEAEDKDRLVPGAALLAPGDRHMTFIAEADGQAGVRLSAGPPVNFCRPAVDPMLESLAALKDLNVLAVILTGMGADGAEGCAQIAAAGGTVMIQDRASSVVWGMPGAVAARQLASFELPIDEIGPAISRLVNERGGLRRAGTR